MPETRSFVYLGGFFRGWLPPLLWCSGSSSPLYLRIFEARLHAADVPDTVGRQEVYKARFFWQRRRPGPSRGVSNLTNRLRVEVFRGGAEPGPAAGRGDGAGLPNQGAGRFRGSRFRAEVPAQNLDTDRLRRRTFTRNGVPRQNRRWLQRKSVLCRGFRPELRHRLNFLGETAGQLPGSRICVDVFAQNLDRDWILRGNVYKGSISPGNVHAESGSPSKSLVVSP